MINEQGGWGDHFVTGGAASSWTGPPPLPNAPGNQWTPPVSATTWIIPLKFDKIILLLVIVYSYCLIVTSFLYPCSKPLVEVITSILP